MSVVAREVSGEETEDERDLKTSITHREKQGSRTDSYINYRIVTEVRSECVHVIPRGRDGLGLGK